MIIKKNRNQIFGASLTTAEKKAMDIEIKNEIAFYNKKNETEIDAIILWILHQKFGFGKKRLKDFYDDFIPEYRKLIDRYEMPEDMAWICTVKLSDAGVELEQWRDEKNIKEEI